MLQGATFKVEPNDADWSRHCPVPPRAHDRRAGRAYARYRTSTSALICVLYSSENTSLVSCHMTVVFAVSLQSVPWAVCALAATTARFMVIHAAAAPQRAAAALENAHATHAAPLPPPPPPSPPLRLIFAVVLDMFGSALAHVHPLRVDFLQLRMRRRRRADRGERVLLALDGAADAARVDGSGDERRSDQ